MTFSRRKFLTLAGTGVATATFASPLKTLHARMMRGENVMAKGYGALVKDPNGLLDLPAGFQYRVFSRTGDMMSDGNPVPGNHDGMTAFGRRDGTIILIRNHELNPNSPSRVIAPESKYYDPLCKGGTTTLIIGRDRQLIKDFASLAGTSRNCAGGITPWASWISSEEHTATPATDGNVSKPHGYNFEVPMTATEPVDPQPLIAMGRFNHEAIAVDPKTGIVYQTEDTVDSLFYRFVPSQPGKLKAGGVLEALKIKDKPQLITTRDFPVGQKMPVEWVRIEDFNPTEDTVRVEGFTKGAAQFSRGEGICYGKGEVFFTCTNGGDSRFGQIWRYIPGRNADEGGTIELFVQLNRQTPLNFPDNLVMAPNRHLMVCEDGDPEQYVGGVTPDGKLYRFARNALNDSEFAGVCFSIDGQTMFVNIQRPGITLAVWGPWIKA